MVSTISDVLMNLFAYISLLSVTRHKYSVCECWLALFPVEFGNRTMLCYVSLSKHAMKGVTVTKQEHIIYLLNDCAFGAFCSLPLQLSHLQHCLVCTILQHHCRVATVLTLLLLWHQCYIHSRHSCNNFNNSIDAVGGGCQMVTVLFSACYFFPHTLCCTKFSRNCKYGGLM